MTTIDEALFAIARGGFWIDEAGTLIPVVKPCAHADVASERWGLSYYGAYAAGRIRVSLEGTCTAYISLGLASVTFEALKALSQILRHGAFPSREVSIEDDFVGWNLPDRHYKFYSDKGASHAASWAMKQAMIKRLAATPTTTAIAA